MQISINGRLASADEAGIGLSDRGFTLGDGLFETIAVHEGRILRLEAHLARLRAGLETLRLPLGLRDLDLTTRLLSLVSVNDLREGSLRLTITRGQGPRGLLPPDPTMPTVIITASPWAGRKTSISAVIASSTRRNEYSPLSRIKALGYLDNILALIEAQERGAEDALLLNGAGHVACASAANLFAMVNGVLQTPPLADGVLPGVVRAQIIGEHKAVERSLTADELYRADEIVLSNALGVRSVVRLDDRIIGSGEPGPLVQELASALEFPQTRAASA